MNKSIEPDFLKDLQYLVSKTIEHPIYVVFKTLFRKYDKINTKILRQQWTWLKQYSYNASIPLDNIFNMIDQYKELIIHAESAFSLSEKMDIWYKIFKKQENSAAYDVSGPRKHTKKKLGKILKYIFRRPTTNALNLVPLQQLKQISLQNKANAISEGVIAQLQPTIFFAE